MDKQAKEVWLKALRSGEYSQTQSTLRDEQGYCCLGVLADNFGSVDCVPSNAQDDRWFASGELPLDDPNTISSSIEAEDADIPNWISNHLEFDGDTQSILIALNDGIVFREGEENSIRKYCRHPNYSVETVLELGETIDGVAYYKGFEPASFDEIADWIEENL